MQPLLSRALIRLLTAFASTFPRPGEGFSAYGTVSDQPQSLPISKAFPPWGKVLNEVKRMRGVPMGGPRFEE